MNRIFNITETETALLLAQASINAYPVNPFPNMDSPAPIDGYTFVKWILGEDFSEDKSIEKFVAIYQKDNTQNYLFAFRGTYSEDDIWIDEEFRKKLSFPFYTKTTTNAQIAQGFHNVYINLISSSYQNKSLQGALFDFIQEQKNKNIPIENLMITGHSLGAALAEIFTIDLCESITKGNVYNVQITHYNFACPRVGDQSFSGIYQHYCINTKLCNIIRFVNYYDYVPCLAPEDYGYVHVSNYYLFNFYECKEDVPHPFVYHSIINYKIVLNQILIEKKQRGQVTGEDSITLSFQLASQSALECDGDSCATKIKNTNNLNQ